MSWNGSNGASAPQQKASSGARANLKGALAGLIVVLGAGAAIYFLLPASAPAPTAPAPQAEESPKVIEEVKPEIVQPATYDEEALNPKLLPTDPDFQEKYPRTPGHLPLRGGNVITFAPPEPGCTTTVYTVGGVYLCDSEGNFTKWEPPKLFDNRFENTLESLAMNRQLLLTNRTKDFSDDEIATYLTAPIRISEDDSPDIVERKMATAAVKDEIRQYIKDGGSYQGYIDELHGVISREREMHREVVKEIIRYMSEGDIEGARECRRQMDEFLGQKGYMGVTLPDVWERKLNGEDSDFND